MAFIDMPRKVRPWKRGLSGLGLVADAPSQAALLDAQAASLLDQASKIREAEARTSDPNAAAALRRQANALDASANSLGVQAEAARQREAQAAEMALRGVQIKNPAATQARPTMTQSVQRAMSTSPARTAAPGNAAYDIKEDPRYYTKTIDANGNAVYRKVEGGSSSFSDVLNSIAEVVGVAAPVADRIVQSEQARRAETVARRAERAAQNALITSGQTPQPSSFPTSTVAYSVGGLVVGGLVLWGLSSLLGGSSTPSVVVAK